MHVRHSRIGPILAAALGLCAGCGPHGQPLQPGAPSRSAPASGAGNAARCYVDALNSFIARREPSVRKSTSSGILHEPQISEHELNALLRGARLPDCDFYGADRIVLRIQPGNKAWVFEFAVDPFQFRPYPVPMRQLAQVALNEGQRRVEARLPEEARRIFEAVAAFGGHVRRKPGSLLDIEIGLDVERRALHYLEMLDARLGREPDRQAHAKRDAALRGEQDAFLAKYASLDDIGRAVRILREDPQPVWRVAAAAGLTTALHTRQLTRAEAAAAREAMTAAGSDPDANVRRSIALLRKLPRSDFAQDPVQAP